MSQENVEVVRDALRRMSEGGFPAVADLIDDDFTMDSSLGVEARQAHDKAGVEEWFAKMEEIWEGGLRFEPEEIIAPRRRAGARGRSHRRAWPGDRDRARPDDLPPLFDPGPQDRPTYGALHKTRSLRSRRA
jgi:hypothetical protein